MSSTSNTSDGPAAPGKGMKKWTDEHFKILAAGMIRLVQASRKDLYLLDGIVGEVDRHGNDVTYSKLKGMLRAFAEENGLEREMVDEGKAKRKAGDGGGGAKKKAKGAKGRGKKVEEEVKGRPKRIIEVGG